MDDVKKYRADWRHVVLTTEDDAQYVCIADYSSKCNAADVYYRAWKSTEEEMAAQRLRADTAEAELKIVRKSRDDELENYNALISELAAAEQRNAILGEEVTSLTTRLNERDKLIEHIGSMIAKACSPNQKPEGESHE
jgi:ribosomal protein L14E/L6E/L27E